MDIARGTMRASGLPTKRTRCRGAAMLLVLFAVAIASILALSFLRSSGPTAAVAANIDRHAEARALAESGLKLAINYVKENQDWRTTMPHGLWLEDQGLSGGVFSVYGTDDDGDLTDDETDALQLSVVATVNGVTHRVNATVEPGTPSIKLEVMFVVRNDSVLTTEEAKKKSLFESWGYDVAVVDDGATQGDFDTAAAQTEVVFISSDASYGSVGSKLRTYPMGVVYELSHMSYYFDISTNGGLSSGQEIEIIDNGHYVTSVFEQGTLAVADSNITLHRNRTTVAAGALRLAEPTWNNDYALLVVETGADLLNGGTAPARRVKLPWTGSTDQLNANGRTLTRRALEWASENEGGNGAQRLVHYTFDQVLIDPVLIGHWRLDDTAGGTGGMIQIADKITFENESYLDAYDASAGSYGGANRHLGSTFLTNATGSSDVDLVDGDIYGNVRVGSGGDPGSVIRYSNGSQVTGTTGSQQANVTIPTYDAPPGFGNHTGNETYDGGSRTWSSDQHFNKLTLEGGARVYISGDVAVRVSNKLHIEDGEIILNPGATLMLWVGHDMTIENGSAINSDTQRAGDLTLIQYGNNRNIDLTDGVIVGAVHVANTLTIENGSAIYGNVTAEDDIYLKDGTIHADLASAPPNAGGALQLTTAVDQSAALNDGSVLGASGGSLGVIGSSFTFDGVDDYVEMPHISSYALESGTFSCWFNTQTTSGRQGLFSKDSTSYDTGGHFSVFIENGKVRVRMQSTDASYWVESGSISTGTWYHIMFAWGAGGMVLYLDGVEVDTNTYAGGLSTTSGGAGNFEPIVLGGNAWQSDDLLATPVKDYFEGRIDDLRIYDDRLNAAQAIELFSGSEPSAQPSEALVQDTSGYEAPLNLAVEDSSRVTWDSGTLTFNQATVARSMGDAAKVRDAILQTGQFSIEARLTRAAPGSTANPSRIVSLSSSSGSRNVTLGQDDSALDVRVRTTVTGSNGILSPNYETGSVLTGDTPVHIVVTYDGENLRTYVDGALVKTQAITGVLTTWDAAMPLLIGNEASGGMAWLGTIDELSIYDRALSTGQAGTLASGGSLVDIGTSVRWDEQD